MSLCPDLACAFGIDNTFASSDLRLCPTSCQRVPQPHHLVGFFFSGVQLDTCPLASLKDDVLQHCRDPGVSSAPEQLLAARPAWSHWPLSPRLKTTMLAFLGLPFSSSLPHRFQGLQQPFLTSAKPLLSAPISSPCCGSHSAPRGRSQADSGVTCVFPGFQVLPTHVVVVPFLKTGPHCLFYCPLDAISYSI